MNKSVLAIFASLLASGIFMALPFMAFAAAGDLQVTVTTELGYPLANATVSFSCPGGSSIGTTTNSAGVVTIASTTINTTYSAANCGGILGKTVTLMATSTGFVASSTTVVTSSASPIIAAVGNVQYGFKVTSMKRESDATSVMPATSTMPFSVSGNLTLASSTFSSLATLYQAAVPTWYLAASSTSSGGTLTATSSGYVNDSISNVTGSVVTQDTIAFDGGSADTYNAGAFKFGLKVAANDQLGNSLTPDSISYRGNAATLTSGNTSYWADTSSTTGPLAITKSGYVLATTTNTGFGQVTTGSTTETVVNLGANGVCSSAISFTGTQPNACEGLMYAVEISTLDGATVTAGNTPVSCTENGTTGNYYCPVPVSDTGNLVSGSKAGYKTGTAGYTPRSATSNPQVTVGLSISKSSSSGSTGGGRITASAGSSTHTVTSVVAIPGCPAGMSCVQAPTSAGSSAHTSTSVVVPASTVITTPHTSATSGVSAVFSAPLTPGVTSPDVARLQTLLSSDPTLFPGGTATGYFGSLTRQAVQRFQVKYGISSPSSPGYGSVGPKTRAMLLKVFGQ